MKMLRLLAFRRATEKKPKNFFITYLNVEEIVAMERMETPINLFGVIENHPECTWLRLRENLMRYVVETPEEILRMEAIEV